MDESTHRQVTFSQREPPRKSGTREDPERSATGTCFSFKRRVFSQGHLDLSVLLDPSWASELSVAMPARKILQPKTLASSQKPIFRQAASEEGADSLKPMLSAHAEWSQVRRSLVDSLASLDGHQLERGVRKGRVVESRTLSRQSYGRHILSERDKNDSHLFVCR